MVAEKRAGQQGELGFLHLPLERVEKTLQQQSIHGLCGYQSGTRVTSDHHPTELTAAGRSSGCRMHPLDLNQGR